MRMLSQRRPQQGQQKETTKAHFLRKPVLLLLLLRSHRFQRKRKR